MDNNIYIPHSRGGALLQKEITVATHIMQSFSNELSSPVTISINVNKEKLIHMCENVFAYIETSDGCGVCYQADVKLVRFWSQLEASRMSSYTNELWYN